MTEKRYVSFGVNNNSKLTLIYNKDKAIAHITHGIKTKVYEVEYGETDIYLGNVDGMNYYFNLNHADNDVYTHHPVTKNVQVLSRCEQNRILTEIICNR